MLNYYIIFITYFITCFVFYLTFYLLQILLFTIFNSYTCELNTLRNYKN